MKVLREGPKLPILHIDCVKCESLLEVTRNDAVKRDDGKTVIKCAVCEHDIICGSLMRGALNRDMPTNLSRLTFPNEARHTDSEPTDPQAALRPSRE